MPSFLSKLKGQFGRHKDDKDLKAAKRTSNTSLLEGKFEAISPNVSPSAANFEEHAGKEKFGQHLSGNPGPTSLATRRTEELPSLRLNEDVNARSLGVVFEDLDLDVTIAERRLSPAETLVLVRACSEVILARGLETLGIMHPHWYAASPVVQRRVIAIFLQSQERGSAELQTTRSPHDVAAVLRWGLRHLKSDGTSFGTGPDWYTKFADAEKAAGYPPTAYTEHLVPQLPPVNLELLSATLDMISSLAAHAEANSISGSKLSKVLGLWLLVPQRVDVADDWPAFYARWERAGRILEHLFLSRIRNESIAHRMPTRLSELVQHYPYTKGTPSNTDLLPRPRFSTRKHDALFVRIETELASKSSTKPKHAPLLLIAQAFAAEAGSTPLERLDLWKAIKTAASSEADASEPSLGQVFADETIRILSLLTASAKAAASPSTPLSPTFTLSKPSGPIRRRSFSMSDGTDGNAPSHAKASSADESTSSPDRTSAIGLDWTSFSTSGFLQTLPTTQPLAATLLDTDIVEKTAPATKKPRTRPSVKTTTPMRRSSVDVPVFTSKPDAEEPRISKSTVALASLVELDEAFIDFWSDALLDAISSDWPRFVLCHLKASLPGLELGEDSKKVQWLVLEQVFTTPCPPTPPPPSAVSPTAESPAKRSTSPRPSMKSDLSPSMRMSSTFSATRKRLFNRNSTADSTTTPKASTTKGKKASSSSTPKIGEMGEVLTEEEALKLPAVPATPEAERPNGLGIAGAAVAGGTAAAAVVVAAAPDETSSPVVVEEETSKVADEPVLPVAELVALLEEKTPTTEPFASVVEPAVLVAKETPIPESAPVETAAPAPETDTLAEAEQSKEEIVTENPVPESAIIEAAPAPVQAFFVEAASEAVLLERKEAKDNTPEPILTHDVDAQEESTIPESEQTVGPASITPAILASVHDNESAAPLDAPTSLSTEAPQEKPIPEHTSGDYEDDAAKEDGMRNVVKPEERAETPDSSFQAEVDPAIPTPVLASIDSVNTPEVEELKQEDSVEATPVAETLDATPPILEPSVTEKHVEPATEPEQAVEPPVVPSADLPNVDEAEPITPLTQAPSSQAEVSKEQTLTPDPVVFETEPSVSASEPITAVEISPIAKQGETVESDQVSASTILQRVADVKDVSSTTKASHVVVAEAMLPEEPSVLETPPKEAEEQMELIEGPEHSNVQEAEQIVPVAIQDVTPAESLADELSPESPFLVHVAQPIVEPVVEPPPGPAHTPEGSVVETLPTESINSKDEPAPFPPAIDATPATVTEDQSTLTESTAATEASAEPTEAPRALSPSPQEELVATVDPKAAEATPAISAGELGIEELVSVSETEKADQPNAVADDVTPDKETARPEPDSEAVPPRTEETSINDDFHAEPSPGSPPGLEPPSLKADTADDVPVSAVESVLNAGETPSAQATLGGDHPAPTAPVETSEEFASRFHEHLPEVPIVQTSPVPAPEGTTATLLDGPLTSAELSAPVIQSLDLNEDKASPTIVHDAPASPSLASKPLASPAP